MYSRVCESRGVWEISNYSCVWELQPIKPQPVAVDVGYTSADSHSAFTLCGEVKDAHLCVPYQYGVLHGNTCPCNIYPCMVKLCDFVLYYRLYIRILYICTYVCDAVWVWFTGWRYSEFSLICHRFIRQTFQSATISQHQYA